MMLIDNIAFMHWNSEDFERHVYPTEVGNGELAAALSEAIISLLHIEFQWSDSAGDRNRR